MLDEKRTVAHSMHTMKRAFQPSTKVTKTWRPTPEDEKLLIELRHKTGIVADVELIRMGLRALAKAQGIGQ